MTWEYEITAENAAVVYDWNGDRVVTVENNNPKDILSDPPPLSRASDGIPSEPDVKQAIADYLEEARQGSVNQPVTQYQYKGLVYLAQGKIEERVRNE